MEGEDGFQRCTVRRWMLERGYGYVQTATGQSAFLHVSTVGEVPVIGAELHAKIAVDTSRADGGLRAVEAFGALAWRERRTKLMEEHAKQDAHDLLPKPPGLADGGVGRAAPKRGPAKPSSTTQR